MISELLTESNRDIYLSHYHIDKKSFLRSRIIVSLVLAFLTLFVALDMNKPIMYAFVPIVAFFGYKYSYYNLMKKKSKESLMNDYVFPTFLVNFITLLSTNGNVYQTLKASVRYLKNPIKKYTKELIDDIDNDNVNDREAFRKFAEKIGTNNAIFIMDLIYEFYEHGIANSKEELRELEAMVSDLNKNKTEELITKKVYEMENYGFWIIVSSVIFLMFFTAICYVAYFNQIDLIFNS